MPRASATTEEQEKPKRAPRKRVQKVVVESESVTEPIKRTRKKLIVVDESVKEEVSLRKAPTLIAKEKATIKNIRRQILVITFLLLLGVGSSAAVGFSDKGIINVEETIAYRNDQARAAGEAEDTLVPVQNTPQEVDGGLIGLSTDSLEAIAAQSATTTATSSAVSASSTQPQGQSPLSNEEAEAVANAAAQ